MNFKKKCKVQEKKWVTQICVHHNYFFLNAHDYCNMFTVQHLGFIPTFNHKSTDYRSCWLYIVSSYIRKQWLTIQLVFEDHITCNINIKWTKLDMFSPAERSLPKLKQIFNAEKCYVFNTMRWTLTMMLHNNLQDKYLKLILKYSNWI